MRLFSVLLTLCVLVAGGHSQEPPTPLSFQPEEAVRSVSSLIERGERLILAKRRSLPFLNRFQSITFSAGGTTAESLAAIRFTGSETFTISIPADTPLEITVVLADTYGKRAYLNPFYLDRTRDPMIEVETELLLTSLPLTSWLLSDFANFEVEIRDTWLGFGAVIFSLPAQPEPQILGLGVNNISFSVHIRQMEGASRFEIGK